MLGTVVGGTHGVSRGAGTVHYLLDQLDLDTGQLDRIPLTFLGHGFSQDPTRLSRAVVFEKKGPGGAVVDLASLEVTGVISATEGHAFYGHGLFSADGSRLYVVEANLQTMTGRITVRDGQTLERLGELPTHGAAPHDCVLCAGGDAMVITNGGGPLGTSEVPSVTTMNLSSGKLLERLTLMNARVNAGHVALTSKGEIALVSAPRAGLEEAAHPGALSLMTADRKLQTMKNPGGVTRRMLGESLSVSVHEPSDVVVVTNPRGGVVTFWHRTERRHLRTMELKSPRGVTLTADGSAFILTHGEVAEVMLLSTATLEPITEKAFPQGVFGGSHVYLRREPPGL